MSERVGVAVIGAGGWGFNHVRTFASLPRAELCAVCDLSEAARARVKRDYPAVQCTADYDEVLRNPAVRGVVIATDAPTHHSLALRALSAGKDLLVEKPLTLSSASAQEIVARAASLERVLMVGHLLLYHPAVRGLKARLDEGELGELLYLTAQRVNLGVVRSNENAWWSLAPHDLSLANYFMNAAPLSVSATGGVFLQREKGIEDVVFATVAYPGGRLAHVHVSWLDPYKTRRLTLVGSKKMAVFDDGSADQKLLVFDKGAVPPPQALSYEQGVRVRTGDIVIPAVPMSEPLKLEAEAFIDAICTRKSPLSDGRAGLSVVRALEAADRSIEQHGAAIAIEAD